MTKQDDNIEIENFTSPGHIQRVDRAKYLAMRKALFLNSDERISIRILTDRLGALVEEGILTKAEDPSHKQKVTYSLTEKGIVLLSIVAQIGIWGRAYGPVTEESGANAAMLERGGPKLLKRMMSELWRTHLPAHPRGCE